MKLIACLFLLTTVVSCATGRDSTEIPSQYKSQILALRNQNVDLAKKCQDLQKQMSDLQSQQVWNQQRMGTIAGEALVSLGYSANDYVVNIDKMKFEKKH